MGAGVDEEEESVVVMLGEVRWVCVGYGAFVVVWSRPKGRGWHGRDPWF